MEDEDKYHNLSLYLQKNKIQVKLSIYYSSMAGFIVNMYRVSGGSANKGELLADSRGATLEEALQTLEPVCGALLEAEADKPWKKTVL